MIRFLIGTVSYCEEQSVVIENNGVGYEIFMPVSALEMLPPVGEKVKIHTFLNVREDAMQLFGFLNREDLELFRLLITVNGIGPKVALGILGFMSAEEIRFAVLADDAKTIAKAPGIGPKTAGKLILELKDKVTLSMPFTADGQDKQIEIAEEATGLDNQIVEDAVEALVVLGYQKAEALRAVRLVPAEENMTVDQLLKLSLKNM